MSVPTLIATAQAAGVDEADVQACLDSGEMAELVNAQFENGNLIGVSGPPSVVIVVDGTPAETIPGALPFTEVKTMLDKYLVDGQSPTADQLLAFSSHHVASDGRVWSRRGVGLPPLPIEFSPKCSKSCRGFRVCCQIGGQ